MGANYSTSDSVYGGSGTDTMTVTNTGAITAGTTTGVETMTATVDTGTDTLALAKVSGLTKLISASSADELGSKSH